MLSTFAIFGFVAAFTVPGFCCRPKEYAASNGKCCPMCHEGTVVKRDCTDQSGMRCSPCEPGTFMDNPNGLRKCHSCSSCDQDHGLFVKVECTRTSDTVCDVLSGYFCKTPKDDTGCSSAEKHTSCKPGQRIKEPGTSRTDTVCEPCQPGTFSLNGVSCTAWTICSETQVKVKEGTTSSDVVCEIASRNLSVLIGVPVILFIIAVILITGFLLRHKKRSFLGAYIKKLGTQPSQPVDSPETQVTLVGKASPDILPNAGRPVIDET